MIVLTHNKVEYKALNYTVRRSPEPEEFASIYADGRFLGSFKVERSAKVGLTLMIVGESDGGEVPDDAVEALEEALKASAPRRAAA